MTLKPAVTTFPFNSDLNICHYDAIRIDLSTEFIKSFGIITNCDKSVVIPTKVITFCGFQYDLAQGCPNFFPGRAAIEN